MLKPSERAISTSVLCLTLLCASALGLTRAVAEELQSSRSPSSSMTRGDVDEDGQLDLTDALYLLRHLLAGGPEPKPGACGGQNGAQNGDVNGDSTLDILDATHLLLHLFAGGPLPVTCGSRETSLPTPVEPPRELRTDMVRLSAGDFDIRGPLRRTELQPAVSADRSLSPSEMIGGLQGSVHDLVLRWSALTGAPSRLHSTTRSLTPPSAAPPRDIALDFLSRHLPVLGLSASDLSELRFSRDFVTQHNGVRHLTVQQQVHGMDVFGGLVQINIDKDGRVLNVGGELMPAIHASLAPDLVPVLTQAMAMVAAARNAHVFDARGATCAGLVCFPLSRGKSRIAYDVSVEDARTPNVYRVLVDAEDGTVLWRQCMTYYSHIPAHGPVYTSDSPNPNTPTGTSAPAARVDTPFNGLTLFPHADPHADWWNGSGEPDRNATRSNNVRAKNDRDGDNDDAEGFPPAVTGENFTFPIDLTMDPSTYTNAAIVNLFYWNNKIHDLFYRLGFDEVSGNFQTDNFSLGGAGGDPVQADAQDNRDAAMDPSLCNANMNTPADGTSPRMQMYQCDGTTPETDGDLDNEVIIHEYTHGVHSRLVPTLTGSQGGMGEGWGDFFAISFLSEPADDLTGSWRVGRWLFFPGGIRREPYSTDQSVFTRTYADIVDGSYCSISVCSNDPTMPCTKDSDCGMGNTCVTLGCSFDFQCQPPNTTIAQGTCIAEVHNTGELWSETLWLARANLVEKYGFVTGSKTIHQLVIDGMKLASPAPTFLDMRDAILLADRVNNDGVNQCLLWDAFARMGLGLSALTTGPDDINPVEAFDTPSTCTPAIQVSGDLAAGNVCVGESVVIPIEVYNTATGDLIISSVTRASGSTNFTVDPIPTVPVYISEGAHVTFNVRFAPTSSGAKSAVIRIDSNDPDTPLYDLTVTGTGANEKIATVIADDGEFGNVCVGGFKDLDLTINNSGGCDLSIDDINSTSASFHFDGVMSFPLRVHPGDSLHVPVRFQPTAFGPASGTIVVDTSDPATPSKVVEVSGNAPPGDIRVTGSTEFGDVCPGELAEKTVSVCNVGLCNLGVTSVAFEPACPDFELINNPFPAPVSPDFCLGVVIRFTPTSAGPKSCSLVIRSDDPDTPVVTLPVTANTPAASIDVPPDQAFPPTVVSSLEACQSLVYFPISNTGKCDLTVTEVKITSGGEEYSILGLPSFPIILQPGHIAGEGDLRLAFAPDQIGRARTGEISVTWVSDAITGATTTSTRRLCGEGVRTGARVLVTSAGAPVALVEKIHLQRINANRNREAAEIDTVDVAMNLAPVAVTPGAPCVPFTYHREYGADSNVSQLLPGYFQVTVTAVVGGKRQTRIVGFSVDTCNFDANINVEF